jgi:hypothetical protein
MSSSSLWSLNHFVGPALWCHAAKLTEAAVADLQRSAQCLHRMGVAMTINERVPHSDSLVQLATHIERKIA